MVDELAGLLADPRPDVTMPGVHFLTGEVTDATTWPPLIQTGASSDAVPTPVAGFYMPTVGDFVTVLSAGGTRVCIGPVNYGAGVRLRRAANQSATGSASTTISWDTEDADLGGFWTSGTDVTIPAACAGTYACWSRAIGAGSWSADSDLQIRVNGNAVSRSFIRVAAGRINSTSTLYLGVGSVIDAVVTSTGATQNFTATLYVIRVA